MSLHLFSVSPCPLLQLCDRSKAQFWLCQSLLGNFGSKLSVCSVRSCWVVNQTYGSASTHPHPPGPQTVKAMASLRSLKYVNGAHHRQGPEVINVLGQEVPGGCYNPCQWLLIKVKLGGLPQRKLGSDESSESCTMALKNIIFVCVYMVCIHVHVYICLFVYGHVHTQAFMCACAHVLVCLCVCDGMCAWGSPSSHYMSSSITFLFTYESMSVAEFEVYQF